jgi:hypothetical protein
VSSGGASGLSGREPFSATSFPAVIRSAACVHRRSVRATSERLVEVRSSAVKYRSFWAGVTMPAWWASRKGTTSWGGGGAGGAAEVPTA